MLMESDENDSKELANWMSLNNAGADHTKFILDSVGVLVVNERMPRKPRGVNGSARVPSCSLAN